MPNVDQAESKALGLLGLVIADIARQVDRRDPRCPPDKVGAAATADCEPPMTIAGWADDADDSSSEPLGRQLSKGGGGELSWQIAAHPPTDGLFAGRGRQASHRFERLGRPEVEPIGQR